MFRILLIDDNPDDRFLVIHQLRHEFSDFQVEEVIEQVGLNKALLTGNFDLVITDYRLRWNDGLTVLREIKSRYPNCPVIMFTNSGNQEVAVEAMKTGLDDYIIKSPTHYVRLLVAVRSALKQVESEQKAGRLEMRLQTLLNRLNVGVFRATLNGHLLEGNASFLHLLGVNSLQETQALDLHELFLQPESSDQHLSQEREVQLHRVDGSSIWVSLSQTLSYSETEPVIEGLIEDITSRKQVEVDMQQLYQQVQSLNTTLEQQVQERTAQLQKALEFEATLKRITDKLRDSLDESQILQTAVQELVFVLGVSCCNTALYNLEQGTSTIRYEYATLNPMAQARLIHIAAFPEVYQQLLQAEYCQFCSLIPNPVRGRVAMLACPIFDDQGVLGDLWLINQQHHIFNELEIRLVQQVASQCAIALRQARLYQAVQAQVEELEKLNRLKDDFLSTVSHELRTPLSNIKLATQMLEVILKQVGVLNSESSKAARYFQILNYECEREISLINDLLELTRLDTKPNFFLTRIDPQVWIPRIIEPFEERVRSQQQRFQVNIPAELPPLTTDLTALERILTELLNNACKYTPSRETISVSVHATAEMLQLCVSNSGVEIAASELSQIFNTFYRIPNNDPWKHGGTGLGLALVKKLVERLGATIQVESAAGQTTFTVQFPITSPTI